MIYQAKNSNMLKFKLRFFTLILFTILSVLVFAQKAFDITIAMGSVHPLESFQEEGFAESGFNLQATVDYPLFGFFSVAGKFVFGNASINEANYRNFLNSQLEDYLPNSYRYDINNYVWVAPMVGLKYRYPIVMQKLYVEAGIFSGVSFNQTPDLNMSILIEDINRTIVTETLGSYNLSVPLLAELGFRFNSSNNLAFRANVGYSQSTTKYDREIRSVNTDTGITDEILDNLSYIVPIKNIITSVGIIYRL